MTKGGSALIPTLKGGVFPLRPLHPREIKSIADGATNLEGFENRVKCLLSEAPVLNVDETGLRVNGKREWLHTAGNDHMTLYAHHQWGCCITRKN